MISFLADLIISGTTISIQPTEYPGAIAQITMDNRTNNSDADEGNGSLTMGALSVGIAFDWNIDGDDDAAIVTPPDGNLCIPADCVLQVRESDMGVLYLYEWLGG